MSEEFFGYQREDGSVGIRNKVLIVPTVVCSSIVATKVAEKVPDCVAIPHPNGCGQFGPDLTVTQNTLAGLANNPNIYGAVVIGLGCEGIQVKKLERQIKKTKKPVASFDIQDLQGGTVVAIEKGVEFAKKMASEAAELKRELFDFSHLVLGLECGGSDSIAGITANPTVGRISDKVIELGGTSILPEFTEWIGTEHLLAKRAINEEVAKKITEPIKHFLERVKTIGVDFRRTKPTPGNIKGGLSTIEEKSLGSIAKSGKAPIQDVVRYSEKPKGKGLYLMLEPGLDVESMTGLAAAGCQVIVMTTGRGTPTGNAVSPVIKVCGNPKTCDWMKCNIDVDASGIITQDKRIDDIADDLWSKLKECNGEQTTAEILGFNEIAIWRIFNQFPFRVPGVN